MTSRNYLCNRMKDTIRRNMYLLVLLSLVLLVVLPVAGFMYMDDARSFQQAPQEVLTPVQTAFINSIGPGNVAVQFVVMGAAVLLAFTGFSYLYTGEKTDFYHSLPLKREELFMVPFLSGFAIFLLPYLVCVGITYFVGIGCGGGSPQAVKALGAAVGINLLFFLVLYSAAVLAVQLTGNLFTGIMGFAGLMSYGPLVYMAYTQLNHQFLYTMGNFRDDLLVRYLSPLYTYVNAADNWLPVGESGSRVTRNSVICGIVLAVLFLGAALWVYKIRPSESYHKSIAFPKLQPIIKVCCVLPISVLAALFFSSGREHAFLWLVVSVVLVAVLLSAAFEFLYTMDIRRCINPRASTGIVLAVLLLVLAGYRMDITGYDKYLPEKKELEAMSVYFPSINERLYYPKNSGSAGGIGEFLNKNTIKDFDDVYKLAETGVEYYKQHKSLREEAQTYDSVPTGVNGEAVWQTSDTEVLVSVYIGYHLKSGKTVYRAYTVPETKELAETIGAVYDNWEYREALLPTSYLQEEEISYFYFQDMKGQRKQLEGTREELEGIYKTYKTELESMTFAQSCGERIVGELEAEQKMTSQEGVEYTDSCALPVYESFTKTMALLEKAGTPASTDLEPEEVRKIKLSVWEEGADVPKEVEIEDKEEMKQLLKNLTLEPGRYGVDNKVEYSIIVTVLWEDRDLPEQGSLYILNDGSLDGFLENLLYD